MYRKVRNFPSRLDCKDARIHSIGKVMGIMKTSVFAKILNLIWYSNNLIKIRLKR